MRAGRLDRKITIQRKTETISDSGAVSNTWATVAARLSASYRALRGDERLVGDQIVANEQVEFGIRWSGTVDDISVTDRIIYPALQADSPNPDPESGRVFDILSVHEIGRREGLLITAYRRADVAP